MYCLHLYGLHVYCALVDLDSSRSPGVRPTPGLTSSIQVVCVYVYAYTNTHTHPMDPGYLNIDLTYTFAYCCEEDIRIMIRRHTNKRGIEQNTNTS